MKIWHPKYGVVYDGMEEMKTVEYELKSKSNMEQKGKKKSSEYDVNGIHRGIQMSFEHGLCGI